jgi:hypothetical protein
MYFDKELVSTSGYGIDVTGVVQDRSYLIGGDVQCSHRIRGHVLFLACADFLCLAAHSILNIFPCATNGSRAAAGIRNACSRFFIFSRWQYTKARVLIAAAAGSVMFARLKQLLKASSPMVSAAGSDTAMSL